MEIGRLILHPADKTCQFLIFKQARAIFTISGQFGIGEILMDRAVANRVEGHCPPALLRFGDQVMPLDARFKSAPAQPAFLRQITQTADLTLLTLRRLLLLAHRIVETIGPARLDALFSAHHAQIACSHIAGHGRASGHDGVIANCHRRDQRAVRSDKGTVANRGLIFEIAIIIAATSSIFDIQVSQLSVGVAVASSVLVVISLALSQLWCVSTSFPEI